MSVVISQNVVMSGLAGGGSAKPIIGWHNVVSRGGVAATFEDQYFPASNLTNVSTASQWRSTSSNEQYITVNVGLASPIDYVGLARHNFGSEGMQVSIEAKTVDNPTVWTVVFTPAVLKNNEPAILRFDPVVVSELRIKLIPTSESPRLSILYVGKLTVMQTGMSQEVSALPYAYDTDVVTGLAESGDFLGRIVTGQSKSMEYPFEMVNYDWYHREFGAFTKHALITPFFFAWLPKIYPDEVGFGWLQSDVRPNAVHYDAGILVSFTLDIGAISV